LVERLSPSLQGNPHVIVLANDQRRIGVAHGEGPSSAPKPLRSTLSASDRKKRKGSPSDERSCRVRAESQFRTIRNHERSAGMTLPPLSCPPSVSIWKRKTIASTTECPDGCSHGAPHRIRSSRAENWGSSRCGDVRSGQPNWPSLGVSRHPAGSSGKAATPFTPPMITPCSPPRALPSNKIGTSNLYGPSITSTACPSLSSPQGRTSVGAHGESSKTLSPGASCRVFPHRRQRRSMCTETTGETRGPATSQPKRPPWLRNDLDDAWGLRSPTRAPASRMRRVPPRLRVSRGPTFGDRSL
jgi:hypothetical protein